MTDQTNTLTDVTRALLAGSLLSYRKKVPMMMRVNRDFQGEAAQKGSTIDVPISTAQTVSNAVASSTQVELSTTDVDLVQITLDQWKETRFHITDREEAEIKTGNFVLPGAFHESIKAHAENVNSYLLGLYNQTYKFVGTAATTPFASNAAVLSAARKKLNAADVPADMRTALFDVDADENAINLAGFQNVNTSGSDDVMVRGEIGSRLGFLNMWDNQTKTHTTAAAGTPLVDDAAVVIGATVLHMDGLTTKPEAGDLFTVAGDSTQYVVVSSTALAGTDSDVTIQPPLAVALADNAAVTFVATHVANLAFHRDAFTFAQRPLKSSSMAPSTIASQTDPQTGLSMRLQIQRPNNVDVWVHDVLFGGKCTRPEAAVRILG